MLAKMLKRSFGAIKPLSEQRHAPDPELSRIIEKMMKVDLSARYQTIEDVIDDLENSRCERRSAPPPGCDIRRSDEDEAIDFDKVQLFLPREHEEEPKETPKTQTKAEPLTESAQLRAEESAEAFEIPVAPPKQVLCVETQSEIQDVFRKSLSKMGYRVFLVGDAERAAERYRETIPDAVIFDTDGLGSEAVDAFLDMHDKAQKDGHPWPRSSFSAPGNSRSASNFPPTTASSSSSSRSR